MEEMARADARSVMADARAWGSSWKSELTSRGTENAASIRRDERADKLLPLGLGLSFRELRRKDGAGVADSKNLALGPAVESIRLRSTDGTK